MATIIYPPTLPYAAVDQMVGTLRQRPHHVMSVLAEKYGHTTVYVDPGMSSGGQERYTNHAFRMGTSVGMGKTPDPNVLYITYPPQAIAMQGLLKKYEATHIWFDAVDIPEDEFKSWQTGYSWLLTHADVVTASSYDLVEYCKKYRDDVVYVPNGVHLEDFTPAPVDVLPSPPYKLVFAGTIASWIHLELLNSLGKRPEFEVTLVGPILGNNLLPSHYSFGLLPAIPYQDLNLLYHSADVLLAPFTLTKMTKGVNPVKVWEYLATGRPVVATNLPDLTVLTHVETALPNLTAWMAAIERAIQSYATGVEDRRNLAASHAWVDLLEPINFWLNGL